MLARLVHPIQSGPKIADQYPVGMWIPVGSIIKGTKTAKPWKLVRCGVAEPADEECRIRADRTPEQIQAAIQAYPAIAKGITPEDRKDFKAGIMDGYNADGSRVPGPNAFVDDQTDEDIDDE